MGGLRARTDQGGQVTDTGLAAVIADEADHRLTALANGLSALLGADPAGPAGDVPGGHAGSGPSDDPGGGRPIDELIRDALTLRDVCLIGGLDAAAPMAASVVDELAELADASVPDRLRLVADLLPALVALGTVLAEIHASQHRGPPPAGPPHRGGAPPPAGPPHRGGAPPPAEAARPTGSRPSVLVVAGSASFGEPERMILEEAGYAVDTAPDATAALGALRRSPVELVLVDADLPGMSGIELTEAIRRLPGLGPIGVVVIGRRLTDDLRRRSIRAGADAVVLKATFAHRDLLGAMARILARPGAGEAGLVQR